MKATEHPVSHRARKPLNVGDVFSSWEVVGEATVKKGHTAHEVRCVCGVVKFVTASELRLGRSKGCGCSKSVKPRATSHGMKGTPTYVSWLGMKRRCLSPDADLYKSYRVKGIKVCDRWLAFRNFLADMGERPPGTTLDRVDNNGNYEPGNCRWASATEQSNNKGNNTRITAFGVEKTLADWSRETGLRPATISDRVFRLGWGVEDALTLKPSRVRRAYKVREVCL